LRIKVFIKEMSSSIRLPSLKPFDGTRIGFISFYRELCATSLTASTIPATLLFIVLSAPEFALTEWAPAANAAAFALPVSPGAIPGIDEGDAVYNRWKYADERYNTFTREYNNLKSILVAALPQDVIRLLIASQGEIYSIGIDLNMRLISC
jgi:hypothetical protein